MSIIIKYNNYINVNYAIINKLILVINKTYLIKTFSIIYKYIYKYH